MYSDEMQVLNHAGINQAELTLTMHSQVFIFLTSFRYGHIEDMQMENDTLLRNMVRYMTRIDLHRLRRTRGFSMNTLPLDVLKI